MRKLAILPVPYYLLKFIRQKGNYQSGTLFLDSKVKLPEVKDFHQSARHFAKRAEKHNLKVFMYDPTKKRLYQLYVMYRELFNQAMHDAMSRDHAMGLKAKDSLVEFLDLYGITEYDYKIDRGLKSWQRYKKRNDITKVHGRQPIGLLQA
jgi:hypothetical protein